MLDPAHLEAGKNVVKEALPAITDDLYIKRFILTMEYLHPGDGINETIRTLFEELQRNEESRSKYVSPFEVMTAPSIQLTSYHLSALAELKKEYNQLNPDDIEECFRANRRLFIPTMLALSANNSYFETHSDNKPKMKENNVLDFTGVKGMPKQTEPSGPVVSFVTHSQSNTSSAPPSSAEALSRISCAHFQRDLEINKSGEVKQIYMKKLRKQTYLPNLPALPLFSPLLPPVCDPNSLIGCSQCRLLKPVHDTIVCECGHKLCRKCFHTDATSFDKITCSQCNKRYTLGALSRFLTLEKKKELSKNHPLLAGKTMACEYPSDTVMSGICPHDFNPLVPCDEFNTWRCSLNKCQKKFFLF